MQDIHDIYAPVTVGMDPAMVKLLALAAGILVLAALVFWLVRRYLKRRQKPVVETVEARIPPYEAAIRALDRLSVKPVTDFKAFYFDLSALFKSYIGGSFNIHAVEMTTQELVKQLRRTRMNRDLVSRISHFQTLSDPFRYAPVAPTAGQAKTDLETVRQLIMAVETDLAPPGPGPGDTGSKKPVPVRPGSVGPDPGEAAP